MTLTYISCSSDFYTFYNIPLSLGCMIRKVSAEDIAIRGNGTGLEYMCPTRHFVYIFFNPVFQVSTAKNEINLFNNHLLIVAPVTFAPAGAMTPSAEFLSYLLMLSTLCQFSYFSDFLQGTRFEISCKLSLMETKCMKCQILFPGKNINNLLLLINMSKLSKLMEPAHMIMVLTAYANK